jgi:tetratricopeptide (TPR) repeat protein
MFKPLLQKQDTAGQIKLLRAWEASNPKDPEMFIAYFNYYAQVSAAEVVSIDANKKPGGAFVLTDSGGSKPVGYLSSSVKYNAAILQKGFDYIDAGIALYPARLDMRFGRIYMLGQVENYAEFAKTIIETINYGHTINDAWLWKDGKPLEDAKNFFLTSMQTYVTTIYNMENDSLLPLMRQISEAVLQYNPAHVESLANVALTYLIAGEYDKALEYLLRAEKVAPKDVVVLNNIAEAYKRKGDRANAKTYLQKVIKFGTTDEQEDIKARLQKVDE